MQHLNLARKNTSTPRTRPQTGSAICPHWAPEDRLCLLVQEEGLFLPVEEHIATFCLDSHYTLCVHFERLAGQGRQKEATTSPPVNRRRSIRIPDRCLFRFSEITGSDQTPGIREDDAWTIDLSDHGIRFATRQLLTPETDVRFVVETGGTTGPFQGIGRIVWSEPLENTALFHAGIVFVEPTCPAA